MTLRQQVEQVLRNHHVHPKSDDKAWWNKDFEQFVDDLLALLTPTAQPDREALEQILERYHTHAVESDCLTCGYLQTELLNWVTPDRAKVREKLRRAFIPLLNAERINIRIIQNRQWEPSEEVLDALTDAVCGTEEPRWCEHCCQDEHGRWVHYDGQLVPMDWDICPVAGCHAPRPGGG